MIRGFAATAKGQIHYRESGEGPPLVLVHETARSSDGFSEVMPLLARQFRVIAMDTPGFGDSYRPTESPGIAGYAQSILDFFDALGLQRPHLLGFHTGAAFAAEAAARAPDRVDRLVLCGCPDFDPDTIPAKLAHHQPFEPTADGRYLAKLWEGFPPVMRHWVTLDYAHRYLIDFLKAMPNNPMWAHQAVLTQNIRQVIPRITAPTLLLCSRNDVFVDRQPLLAPLFQRATTAIIAESEKFPLVNQPERSAAIITAFLLADD